MKDKIKTLIQSIVPNAFIIVEDRKTFYQTPYLKILVAGSDKLINNVQGQYPGAVSLSLDLDKLVLEVQGYGGTGGQSILINIDKNNPRERFLAYSSVTIPFRKPKAAEANVMQAIAKFVSRWKEAIKENLDRMPHNDLADWKKVIE
jgi:hypothetical protein